MKFSSCRRNGMMLNLTVNTTVEILFRFILKIIISGCEHFFKTPPNPFLHQIGMDFGLAWSVPVVNGNGLIVLEFITLTGVPGNQITGRDRLKIAWKSTTTEHGMTILVRMNFHSFAKKLHQQNGVQLQYYLVPKRAVAK